MKCYRAEKFPYSITYCIEARRQGSLHVIFNLCAIKTAFIGQGRED